MNKEEVYDQKIDPIMKEIIRICMESGIGMFATFAIPTEDDPSLACTTSLPDETGDIVPIHKEMRNIALRGQELL